MIRICHISLLLLLAIHLIGQGSEQSMGSTNDDPGTVFYYDGFDEAIASDHDLDHILITKGFNEPGDGGGATYIVKSVLSDPDLEDGYGAFQLGSGLYAVMQPNTFGKVSIESFGAIANDNLSDDQAIQRAIDWAKIGGNGASGVVCGPGTFDIDTGLVMAIKNGAEFDQITLSLSGNKPIYGVVDDDCTTFRVRGDEGFGLAIQEGRKVDIENIRFLGESPYASNHIEMITWDMDDWTNSNQFRSNVRSPYSGIVIDPFCLTDVANGYPDFTSYYTNSSIGGSSVVTISGCAFDGLLVAIMNNPSSTVKNGDNIEVRHCNFNRCRTALAAGQDQSRANVIYNSYVLSTHTTIDGRNYGNGIGTLPVIDNCNIAGMSKYIYQTNSDLRADVRITETYCESLWSLGVGDGTHVTFEQSTLKFSTSLDYWRPTFISEGAHFNGCVIQYYGGPNVPLTFAGHASFTNCHLNTGLPLRDYSNSGGEIYNDIAFAQTTIHNYSGAKFDNSSQTQHGIPDVNLYRHPLLGGSSIGSSNLTRYENKGEIYYRISLGSRTVGIKNNAYYVVHPKADELIKPGDILTTLSIGFDADLQTEADQSTFKAPLGVVESVNSDTAFLTGCPYGLAPGTYTVHIIEVPYLLRFIGNSTAGNDTIKTTITSENSGLRIGRRFTGQGIDPGSYITAIGADYVVLSAAAIGTHTQAFYEGVSVKATFDDYPSLSSQIHKVGDQAFPRNLDEENLAFYCTEFGKNATAKTPVWITPQQFQTVSLNGGSPFASRPNINIVEGANVTAVIADDAGNNETDITLSATGGGGGGGGDVYKSGNLEPDGVAFAVNDSTITTDVANLNYDGTGFGIGLDAVYKLDLLGDMRISGHLGLDGENPNGSYAINAGGHIVARNAADQYALLHDQGRLQLVSNGNEFTFKNIAGVQLELEYEGSDIVQFNNGLDAYFLDRVRIENGLSINTANASYPLVVQGNGSTSGSDVARFLNSASSLTFQFQDDGSFLFGTSNNLRFESGSGELCVGCTGPSSALQVRSSGANVIDFATSGGIFNQTWSSASYDILWQIAASGLSVNIGTRKHFTLTPDGIGFGTTNPVTAVQIVDTLTLSGVVHGADNVIGAENEALLFQSDGSLEAEPVLQALSDDSSPELAGDLALAGNAITEIFDAGETISAGDLCVLDSIAADGEFYLADRDTSLLISNMLVMAAESGTDGNPTKFIIEGKVGGFSGLTRSRVLYVSDTPGEFQDSKPTSGQRMRIIGYTLSPTEIFFKPSSEWILVE